MLAAETAPSSPLPPDMCCETYEAFAQLPGQPKVRAEEPMLVYVTYAVQESGPPDEYGWTTDFVQMILNPV